MVMFFRKFDIILVCSVTIVLVSSFCLCNRDKIETEKIGEMTEKESVPGMVLKKHELVEPLKVTNEIKSEEFNVFIDRLCKNYECKDDGDYKEIWGILGFIEERFQEDNEFIKNMKKVKSLKEGMSLLFRHNLDVINNEIRNGKVYYANEKEIDDAFAVGTNVRYCDGKKIVFLFHKGKVFGLLEVTDFEFKIENKEMFFYKNVKNGRSGINEIFFNMSAVGYPEVNGKNALTFFKAKRSKFEEGKDFNKVIHVFDSGKLVLYSNKKGYYFDWKE